jgi:hypothetical protein
VTGFTSASKWIARTRGVDAEAEDAKARNAPTSKSPRKQALFNS